jgi:hypothetical protein
MHVLIGLLLLIGLVFAARWYVNASPAQLAHGLRAFVATFSALASTGLLFTGRFGLALITLAAMIYAIRSMRQAAGAGLSGFGGGGGPPPAPPHTPRGGGGGGPPRRGPQKHQAFKAPAQ